MWEWLIGVGIVVVVAALIRWQWNFITGFWQDGGRGQFLVMGMPAVIFLVLGVAAFGLAAVNLDNLDSHYENLQQKANESAQQIREKIIQEKSFSTGQSTQAVIPEDLKVALEDAQQKEQIYLEKLISLDNNNDEYKFQLALLDDKRGETQKAISLLQMIGPFDEPGYAKAHLTLAQHYLMEARKARSQQAKSNFLAGAEKQINNCLIADETSVDAKRIKAFIHDQNRQYLQAYEIYQELFEEDPLYYRDLLRLSALLGKESDRKSFLDQAAYQFRQMTKRSDDNVQEWTDAWKHYVACMKMKRDQRSYNESENAVKGEIGNFNEPTDIGKKVFLQRLLSTIYSDRAISRGRSQPLAVQKQQLTDLALAIENDKKNEAALQWLTMLGTNPELSSEVKKIYDPQYDPDVPWVVLSELGHDALAREDFDNAILYFEGAKKKQPRHPHVLNNLAYALLVAKNRNPERALLLVDQAINNIRTQPRQGQDISHVAASFFDTRGVALMQLERHEEATAAFEIAFNNRPKDKGILKNLIECYNLIGNERQAETFRRRLERLEKEELATPK